MPEPHDQPAPADTAAEATPRSAAAMAPGPGQARAGASGAGAAPLAQRLRELPGLPPLVAEAEGIWRDRARAAGLDPDDGDARPGWRTFEDSFPTFYEFTNRPR